MHCAQNEKEINATFYTLAWQVSLLIGIWQQVQLLNWLESQNYRSDVEIIKSCSWSWSMTMLKTKASKTKDEKDLDFKNTVQHYQITDDWIQGENSLYEAKATCYH